MANFALLRNSFTKLHPFSLYSHSACLTTSLVELTSSNQQTKNVQTRSNSNYCKPQFHQNIFEHKSWPTTLKATCKHYSSVHGHTEAKVQSTSANNSGADIDEFRAREEQRDKEYTNQSANSSSDDKNDEKINEIRSKIMDASLAFVAQFGWSRDAISKGAESIGYPGVVHGMFPNGGIELVHYFYSQCNHQLIEQLKLELESNKSPNPIEFVTRAVRHRLQMIQPYLAHWPQALGLMSLPPNVPTSLAQLLTLVDDICFYAGDRSVDFGWYTRRIGLATIYKMTELYMLQDKSTDYQDTWKFLERRIEEGHQLQEVLTMGDQTTKRAVNSAFLTARNVLGLNFNRR